MTKMEAYAGIDIGGTNINYGIIDYQGHILLEEKSAVSLSDGVQGVFDLMTSKVFDMAERVSPSVNLMGIGVGIAGLVDYKRGLLYEAFNLPGWTQTHVETELRKRTQLHVVVDNDANLAALGEYEYGAGQHESEMVMITLGSGVGSGFILNGEIYRGARGVGGELGHTIIKMDGPVCTCGRKGCLEAYVGKYAIIRAVREGISQGRQSLLARLNPDEMTPKDVSQAAAQGDELARDVFHTAGKALGVGIANVCNMLNIERVVIGGGVAKAGDLILEPARQQLKTLALYHNGDGVKVVGAQLGEHAGIVGAARLAMIHHEALRDKVETVS